MTSKKSDSRCKASTKNGTPCRAAAPESGLCYFHGNPNKASELGRIGGRRKVLPVAENVDPLPTLNSAMAVRETVARLVSETYAGKLSPRIAAGLGSLLNLQLRTIEITNLERCVESLETWMTSVEAENDRDVKSRTDLRGLAAPEKCEESCGEESPNDNDDASS